MTTLEIIRNTKAAWGSVRDGDAAAKNHILTAMADSLTAHTHRNPSVQRTGYGRRKRTDF